MASGKVENRSFFRGTLFFAGSLLPGLALVTVAAAWGGKQDMSLDRQLWFGGLLLTPYAFIGMMAALASRSGATTGWCACLGGFASVIALYGIGYMSYQDSIRAHASTGAALAGMMFVCAAVPGSLVGSAIGWAIGRSLSRRRKVFPQQDR
jgi:hypothetical protein